MLTFCAVTTQERVLCDLNKWILKLARLYNVYSTFLNWFIVAVLVIFKGSWVIAIRQLVYILLSIWATHTFAKTCATQICFHERTSISSTAFLAGALDDLQYCIWEIHPIYTDITVVVDQPSMVRNRGVVHHSIQCIVPNCRLVGRSLNVLNQGVFCTRHFIKGKLDRVRL